MRAARREDGQALVELALILPVLLLIVFGIIDFGRALNLNDQATNIANQAARYAAVNQPPPGACGSASPASPCISSLSGWVQKQVTGSVGGTPTVCVTNGTSVGQPVTVSVSFTYSWLPILGLGFPSSPIAGSATMRIEQTASNSFYANGCTT
jgi:hypothetical protein